MPSPITADVPVIRPLSLVIVVPMLLCQPLRAADFNVDDHGAVPDGKTVCTSAIQRAIDAAAAAGGGDAVVSRGPYLTGSVFLKSKVNLRIDEGGELRGVQDDAAYPDMWTRAAGIELNWPAALINVCEQSGCRIYGKGVIDGQGQFWWHKFWGDGGKPGGVEVKGGMLGEYEKKGLRWAVDYDCKRPRLIQVYKSSDVSIENITLRRAGFWTVHVCFSQRVTVDGVTIRNNIGGYGPSSDGVDIDSSAHVLVQNCDIDCNDDSLCLKAGRDADGLRVNRPTEHVVMRDCIIRGGHSLFTIGSETSGGIRHVEAYRIKAVADTGAGIRFKSTRTRGGTIDDVDVHDIEMDGVSRPIEIDLNWYPAYSNATLPAGATDIPAHWKVLTQPVTPPERGVPHFRNVRLRNVKATKAQQAFNVAGYADAPLEDFLLEGVKMEAKQPGTISHAARWRFKDVSLQTPGGKRVAMKDCKDMTGDVP
jgi:polygalacturonase